MRVLITDGDQRSALATTRSLGKSGHDVIVGETRRPSLAGASRYCRGMLLYTSPRDDENLFLDSIVRGVIDEKIDLVIPTADLTSAILSENKALIERHAKVAVVDPERLWAAADKNRLHHLAERLGIPTPTLHFVGGSEEGIRLADLLIYPCVLKPSRSQLRHRGRWIATSVRRVPSRSQFTALFRERVEYQYPCMVQKEVEGDGFGVFALCRDGEPLALFAHHRLREKPPWGGVSVLRESVPLDPTLVDFAVRILREIRWHGLAMVEFKREARSGTPYLMEVNGRLWGSVQLAIDAGIDFPAHLVDLYAGNPVAPSGHYRSGIRTRWLLGDLDHLIARLKRDRQGRVALQPLWSVLGDFLWPFRRDTRLEVERWDDLGPCLYEVRAYARGVFRSMRAMARIDGSKPRHGDNPASEAGQGRGPEEGTATPPVTP